MTTILIKKKDTAGAPAPGDLTNAAGGAELAVNTATKRLYTKDSGGNIVEVGTNPSTIDTTTVNATNLEVTNLKAKDGTAAGSIANSTGLVTLASSVLTTTDINGGSVDGATIGAASASTGAFTSLTSSSTTTLNGTTIPASKTLVDTDTAQTLTNKTLGSGTAVTAGTINGTTIGATTATTGTFTTLTATADSSFTSTGALTISKGTVAQRPGAPAAGMLRFNDDSDEFEGYNGTAWASVGGEASVEDLAVARPTIRPSLLLDFANTEALDPRITFDRASTATYYGTQTAKAEQNLFIRSQEFDNAAWTKQRSNVTANDAVAPDGTTTAEKFFDDNTATASHNLTVSAGTLTGDYTVSVFAKADARTWLIVNFSSGGNQRTWFNLSTGVVGTSAAGNTASITSVGNGWYRCVVTRTLSAATTIEFSLATADNSSTYSGDGTSGLFLWGAQLEQRDAATAYTPTTTQAITNYIPVLQTAASGVARFDHNPTTFESLGLLIEEQRTNLLERSEEFDNAYWAKTRSSITANTVVSPDGTVDADKLVEDTTANNTHAFQRSFTPVGNTTYTFSVYLKKAERSFALVQIGNFSQQVSANPVFVNLDTGTIVSATDLSRASITSVGNSWYRVSTTSTTIASPTSTINPIVLLSTDGTSSTYTGDGYSGIYIWGAQLEAGAFPTSYIPTVASQVTRSADAASMTGADFSSWYNQAEGSLYAEWDTALFVTGAALRWSLSDGTSSNRVRARLAHGSAYTARHDVTNAGTVTALGSPSAVQISGTKEAVALAANAYAGVLNAGTAATSSTLVLPTLTTLHIGNDTGLASFLNGHIRKLSYYPKALTAAELQGLTS